MHRGARLWQKWDARVDAGDPPVLILPDVSDESLLELVASGGTERHHSCSLLLAEALNRLARTRLEVLAATDAAHSLAEDARRIVDVARRIDGAPTKGPGSPHWILRRLEHDRVLASARLDELRALVLSHARAPDAWRRERASAERQG